MQGLVKHSLLPAQLLISRVFGLKSKHDRACLTLRCIHVGWPGAIYAEVMSKVMLTTSESNA